MPMNPSATKGGNYREIASECKEARAVLIVGCGIKDGMELANYIFDEWGWGSTVQASSPIREPSTAEYPHLQFGRQSDFSLRYSGANIHPILLFVANATKLDDHEVVKLLVCFNGVDPYFIIALSETRNLELLPYFDKIIEKRLARTSEGKRGETRPKITKREWQRMEWVTLKDMSSYYDFSMSKLRNMRTMGNLPAAKKIGRELRFNRPEIDKWWRELETDV